jgi:enoyl-CoA hydratase/carnithine racemase
MGFVEFVKDTEGIASVKINRPKVNALNESLVDELTESFQSISDDSNIRSVILTGEGSFFSFGLDVPEFLGYSKESFTKFLFKFTDLIKYVFLFPKPVIAALNGHTIAAGCMLAMACDYRVMVSNKAKISLNEITFGSTVFASCAEILKFVVGGKNAERVLYSGTMYTAKEARELGLIDEVVSKEELKKTAIEVAKEFAKKDTHAFRSIKSLLRERVAEEIGKREKDSIFEFVDIWYSESTRRNLKDIKIHS